MVQRVAFALTSSFGSTQRVPLKTTFPLSSIGTSMKHPRVVRSRWASFWASRTLAFCSTAATASAPATKRSGGLEFGDRAERSGEFGGISSLVAVHAPPVAPESHRSKSACPTMTAPAACPAYDAKSPCSPASASTSTPDSNAGTSQEFLTACSSPLLALCDRIAVALEEATAPTRAAVARRDG